ncbi:MAG: hypothetical protein IKO11_01085 [Lachnospiraceae bacterium]|nr:hypothetical protein [Lachnospiraceae bacterium]
MKFTLHHSSGDTVISLKNVKAKKTTPKVRTSSVNIYPDANGTVKGSVNIVSYYTGASGYSWLLVPTQVNPGTVKGAEFAVNDYDRTEIDVLSLAGKSGSVKVTLTFPGGVTKNVTVKVKTGKKRE